MLTMNDTRNQYPMEEKFIRKIQSSIDENKERKRRKQRKMKERE